MTRDSYNLNLPAKLMVLHCQILLNLAIAAIAEPIMMPQRRQFVLLTKR